jgi:hypothetical protein
MANLQEIIAFAKTCRIKDGVLQSPLVYSLSLVGKAKTPRYHTWSIYIGLWNGDTPEKITAVLIKSKNLDGYTARYWTISGYEGGAQPRAVDTIISVGKNKGRANETTPLTQAIHEARSAFNNKIRHGGSIDKNSLRLPGSLTIDELIQDKSKQHPWRVFGMALHDVNKTNNWRHITYPGIIQPKYDGTRYIVVAHPKFGIDGYSRGRESYEGQEHILAELKPLLVDFPGLYIDGELWREGYGLQQVSGSSRRQTDADKLNYYIFDCFALDKKMGYLERSQIVNILKDLVSRGTGFEHIKFAPSLEYKTKDEALHYYGEYLNAGYEGGVLRNRDSLYEWDVNREKRSYTTLKIKPMDDDDWPLVGFMDGSNGKDVGALIWILEATPETIAAVNEKRGLKTHLLPTPDDNKFNAVPKGMTYEQRYQAYKYLTDNPNYFKGLVGKMMRVQFSIISDYGKPQQPKVLGFKDLELNKDFMNKLN